MSVNSCVFYSNYENPARHTKVSCECCFAFSSKFVISAKNKFGNEFHFKFCVSRWESRVAATMRI